MAISENSQAFLYRQTGGNNWSHSIILH